MNEPKNNFLKPKQLGKPKKNIWKKLKIPLIVTGVIICFILILIAVYYSPAKKTYNQTITGKNEFLEAKNYVLSQEFELAGKSLDGAVLNFKQAQKEFKKFKWLKIIPWVGKQVSVVDNLLKAGIETGEGINKMVKLAEDIIAPFKEDDTFTLSSLNAEDKKVILEKIYQAKPQLEEVKKQIDQATNYVNQIPEKGLLKKLKEIAIPLKEQVKSMQLAFEKGIPATQLVPPLVGYPEQKTYLFLLQNNTELRPTGGFIGTYGILKVKNGEIMSFNTDNIYNFDAAAESYLYIEPPWPLTRYNKVFKWFMRDSNWSPDFPASAQKAIWFYKEENGPEKEIDGVMAITPDFIESLLLLTGEIKVNGINFSSENFTETLQYQVEQGFLRQGLVESERKEIIGDLSKILIDNIFKLPKDKWPELWKVIINDFKEKNILIYLDDESLQKMIQDQGWAGEVKKVDSDFFMVVDANLASLKSDPGVKRTISYQLTEKDNQLEAEVKISYANQGTLTWKTTRYRTYTRLYVPRGSKLISSEGQMVDCKLNEKGSVEEQEELDKTVFGTFVCVEPQEEKQLVFRYQLPAYILENMNKNKNYHLLIQKQPGTDGHDLYVELNFKSKWTWITPFDKLKERSDNKLKFEYDLKEDREFNITL